MRYVYKQYMSIAKKIAFYAGAAIPIHAQSLEERALGGTETGVIRLAEALELLGHQVTVFTSHREPREGRPRYLHFSKLAQVGEFDLIVLVQEWKGVFFNLPTKRVWFWTGDGPEIYSTYGIGDKRVGSKLELLIAVSKYHKEALAQASGFPRDKIVLLGNGVHLPFFEGTEPRNRQRLIYTAAPYRGLVLVPSLLLELQKSHPQVEFHSFSGMNLYDREKPFEGPHVAQYQQVAQLLRKIDRVTLHGNVLQRELSREYMRSGIFFYPCAVPETCCITALEAQAGGCAIVTSSLGALRETVGQSGVCVPGDPGTKEFHAQFLKETRRILDDAELWQSYSDHGRVRAERELGWPKIAQDFARIMSERGI